VTMRSTYERINKGDIAGFGDLVANDFVEHQGAGGPGFPPTKSARQ
jgi:ketosteroid isomerase-like protein